MAMFEAVSTSREAPAHDLTSTQHVGPVGASHEEDERRDPGLELNSALNGLEREQTTVITKWKNDQETSILLERLGNVGRIRKTEGATHWELISQEILAKLRVRRTPDECRRRYDTLLKAYKQVENTGKSFLDIPEEKVVQSNLRTRLPVKWFKVIHTIEQGKSGTAKSRKRIKRSPDVESDMPSGNPAPPPKPSGSPGRGIPSRKQVAIPEFSTLREDLRLTLLNLIQFSVISTPVFAWPLELEAVCRMLAIVEDRKPWEIRKDIHELSNLKLVDRDGGNGLGRTTEYLREGRLQVFIKFAEKVLCKNPDFNFYLTRRHHDGIVSVPEGSASLPLQQIRVLVVIECSEVEEVDLSCFPALRFLSIQCCFTLRRVTGWEVVTKLGWLEIVDCESYVDFPPVQYLSSLRECSLGIYELDVIPCTNSVPDDFRQCGGLRRLNIWVYASSAVNEMELSTLRFLEVLTLHNCNALTSIQGLSALHSLTTLDLSLCKGLKRVPELGCLKALTRLDMRGSGVEEIPGVQELYSLTLLHLSMCRSLKELPFLGHLKALASLHISQTLVKKIPGVEHLVSLEILYCDGSDLEGLPDLHHLPHLQRVWIEGTPLSRKKSSPFYFGKDVVSFGSSNVRGKVLVAEISDISDTESIDSHDNYC